MECIKFVMRFLHIKKASSMLTALKISGFDRRGVAPSKMAATNLAKLF